METLNLRTEINLFYIILQTGKLLCSTKIIITFPEHIYMSLSGSQSWNCKPQKSNIATTTFIAGTYLYILAITVTPLVCYFLNICCVFKIQKKMRCLPWRGYTFRQIINHIGNRKEAYLSLVMRGKTALLYFGYSVIIH